MAANFAKITSLGNMHFVLPNSLKSDSLIILFILYNIFYFCLFFFPAGIRAVRQVHTVASCNKLCKFVRRTLQNIEFSTNI